MIISGNSVRGVFKYHSGYTFEQDDIVLYDGVAYLVVATEVEGVVPSNDGVYYSFLSVNPEANSLSEGEDFNDINNYDKYVPASLLNTAIKSVIGGMLGGRDVEYYDSTTIDLDEFTKAGVYLINGDQLNSPVTSSSSGGPFLLMVHNSGDHLFEDSTPSIVVQTLLGSTNIPVKFYRSYSSSTWGSWAGEIGSNQSLTNIQGLLNQNISLKNDLTNVLDQFDETSRKIPSLVFGSSSVGDYYSSASSSTSSKTWDLSSFSGYFTVHLLVTGSSVMIPIEFYSVNTSTSEVIVLDNGLAKVTMDSGGVVGVLEVEPSSASSLDASTVEIVYISVTEY